MAEPGGGAAEQFAALCADYAGRPGVTLPGGSRAFGSSALKVDGSIFAMLVNDTLVVKLPAGRVAELVRTGLGTPFLSGRGSPMREWVQLVGAADIERDVADAYAFVAGPRH